MDTYLVDVVLLRHAIEHRLVNDETSMAQAINQVAWEAKVSPRYANMVLMGDKLSGPTLFKLDAALTRLSDDEGSVPDMCCTPEAAAEMTNQLRGGNA